LIATYVIYIIMFFNYATVIMLLE